MQQKILNNSLDNSQNLYTYRSIHYSSLTSGVSRKSEWEGTKMPKVHWE